MILLSTAGENAVHINPIFRFFLFYYVCSYDSSFMYNIP